MTDSFDKSQVKILARTYPVDGYPPEEWESLWATPMGASRFKIDNIPFYVREMSCDDIIEAHRVGNEYIFHRVIEPSDNSTIRVVLYDLEDEAALRQSLTAKGCSIEGTGTPGLIAVNVPQVSLEGVIDMLEEAFAEEKLDFEEGALRG